MKIALDIGGVISKYPTAFKMLIALPAVEVHIISDIHPVEKIISMLALNDIFMSPGRVHSADYITHGENCKAVLCAQLGITFMVDDFMAYVADPVPGTVRLLVMPDTSLPYYAGEWKTDGTEGDFGRRRKQ